LVAFVDVVVRKVNINLSIVDNPICDIGTGSRSQGDNFVNMSSLESVHEWEDLV